jgi:hypothetical protein
MEVLHGQAELLEIVGALRTACGLAGGLHGGEQQCYQHADDGDYHQQLHESKRSAIQKIPFDKPVHRSLYLSATTDGMTGSQRRSKLHWRLTIRAALPRKGSVYRDTLF